MAFGNRSASSTTGSGTTPSRTSTEGPTTTATHHTGTETSNTSALLSQSQSQSQSQSHMVTLSSGGETGTTSTNNPDLAVFVQDLLEQMQTRFSELGDSITGKMDDMGRRMDELEGSKYSSRLASSGCGMQLWLLLLPNFF